MEKIREKFTNWFTKTSTLKLYWYSIGLWGLFLFLAIVLPQNNFGKIMGTILFALSMFAFGMGGIPMIIRREYPYQIIKIFKVFDRLAKVEAALFGWMILIMCTVLAVSILLTLFK
jgi:hypothetical protein